MALGTGLIHFAKQHPDRFCDVGIAEGHAVTFAAGLASQGYRPIVAIYSSFLQRAYDSLIHDVALQNLPVIFAIDRAGLVGDDGPTHHGVFDLSYLRIIPNLVVMAPKDELELKQMLYTALKYDNGPIALRYPRGTGIGVSLNVPYEQLAIGEAEVVQKGNDVLIIGIGTAVYNALKSSELLSEKQIRAQVINARFVKPLDEKLFTKMFDQFQLIVTVEDNAIEGGFGSEIAELIAKHNKNDISLIRVGIPDQFIEHGSIPQLQKQIGLDAENIAQRILNHLDVLKNKKRGIKRWL